MTDSPLRDIRERAEKLAAAVRVIAKVLHSTGLFTVEPRIIEDADTLAAQVAGLTKALDPALKALKEDDDNLRYERHRLKDDDFLSVNLSVGALRALSAAGQTASEGGKE